MSMVRNGMVLQKLWCFVRQPVGISTDFYYKESIEIGTKPAFSIWHRALYVRDIGKLILEGPFFALQTLYKAAQCRAQCGMIWNKTAHRSCMFMCTEKDLCYYFSARLHNLHMGPLLFVEEMILIAPPGSLRYSYY